MLMMIVLLECLTAILESIDLFQVCKASLSPTLKTPNTPNIHYRKKCTYNISDDFKKCNFKKEIGKKLCYANKLTIKTPYIETR